MITWLSERTSPRDRSRDMTCFYVVCIYWFSLTWAASVSPVESTSPPIPLYWNKTSSLFASARSRVVDVQLKDTISFFCPYNGTDSSNFEPEYYTIYMVPAEYNNCTIPPGTAEDLVQYYNIIRIVNCTNNARVIKPTLLITDYPAFPSPLAGGITFQSGTTYYFMTPSTGSMNGINNRDPALSACSLLRMSITLRVGYNASSTDSSDMTAAPAAVSTAAGSITVATTTTVSPSTKSSTVLPLTSASRAGSTETSPPPARPLTTHPAQTANSSGQTTSGVARFTHGHTWCIVVVVAMLLSTALRVR